MILNLSIGATVLTVAALLWLPHLRRLPTWRAMTTPLASIIGCGFLVLGPILDAKYGVYAPLAMALLCALGYAFGGAIRYNMATGEGAGHPRLETASAAALGFAYIVSVAYYLNLFGALGVSLLPFDSPFAARLLTSVMFGIILGVGWTRDFAVLERMEYVSVSIKLAIIAGLLIGLGAFFGGKPGQGTLVFNPPEVSGWGALTLMLGLNVTVQGFETSRYLGAEYDTVMNTPSPKRYCKSASAFRVWKPHD